MEERLAAVEARLVQAERSARRSRMLATIALFGVVAVLALGQSRAETARKGTRLKAPVEIVDEEGIPRIHLLANGSLASIAIDDANQRNLVSLGTAGSAYVSVPGTSGKTWGGGRLHLSHSTGETAAEISPGPDGTSFHLRDAEGKPLIASNPGDVSTGFSIYNRQGKRIVELGSWERDGQGRVRLLINEVPTLVLGPGPDETGLISFNRNNQNILTIPGPRQE